jgi:hypothetical protein
MPWYTRHLKIVDSRSRGDYGATNSLLSLQVPPTYSEIDLYRSKAVLVLPYLPAG